MLLVGAMDQDSDRVPAAPRASIGKPSLSTSSELMAPGTSDPLCDPALPANWPATCFAFASGQIPRSTPEQQDFLRAFWNYLIISSDRSLGVHNAGFAVEVLQRSYRVVAGTDLPGATLR